LAVDEDGTVWAWGTNSLGQLGVGLSPTQSTTPVAVEGLEDVIAVAAGDDHSLALQSDGTVWAWGFNVSGQLGPDGPDAGMPQRTPVQVPGITSAVAIAAAGSQSLALLDDGTVLAWGLNANGELGRGMFSTSSTTPEPVEDLEDVIAIAAGGINAGSHVLALKADGTVWAWGKNGSGELAADRNYPALASPEQVPGITDAIGVAAGSAFSFALLEDGSVMAWGANNVGQLGTGETSAFIDSPVEVADIDDAIQIAGGLQHVVALHADGSVSTWGANAQDQLGTGGGTVWEPDVESVSDLEGVNAIAAGTYHSLVATDDGVWAWGWNLNAQLGGGDVGESRGVPGRVW